MVAGYLAMAEGCHVSSMKPSSVVKVYQCLYTTALHSTGSFSFPGELCIYSPFNDVILPDNTVGYVMVRVYFPPNMCGEKILLEASHFFPLPGDPSSDAYEPSILSCLMPFVLALGSVPSHPSTLSDSSSHMFMVVISNYVQDGRMSSSPVCFCALCLCLTDDPTSVSQVHF
ncbi:hypothetical protein EDD17DRAFT_1479806 [Pisolithus thermaeus]|nr:hypothetical protein EV401DRAFT_1873022 [Pisolithus croceorrhizus]KAI6161959.1 hypothetical protein EDD17DRAFT_1479806 [Pisolithus thermaeus]